MLVASTPHKYFIMSFHISMSALLQFRFSYLTSNDAIFLFYQMKKQITALNLKKDKRIYQKCDKNVREKEIYFKVEKLKTKINWQHPTHTFAIVELWDGIYSRERKDQQNTIKHTHLLLRATYTHEIMCAVSSYMFSTSEIKCVVWSCMFLHMTGNVRCLTCIFSQNSN